MKWPTRTRWRRAPADRCNWLNSWWLSAPYGHIWQACGTWGDLPPEPEEHIKDSVEDYLYLSYLSVVSCPSEQCRQQRAAWTPVQCQGSCQNGWPWPAPRPCERCQSAHRKCHWFHPPAQREQSPLAAKACLHQMGPRQGGRASRWSV